MRRAVLALAATVVGLVLVLGYKSHGVQDQTGSDPSALNQLAVVAPAPGAATPAPPLAVSPQPATTTAASAPTGPPTSTPATSAPPPLAPAPPVSHSAPVAPVTSAAPPPPVTRTINGSAVRDPFGTVQVAITVTGTRITGVTPLQVPMSGISASINTHAVPILEQEALAAQSASINTVSGATYTSNAFRTSLQNALAQR